MNKPFCSRVNVFTHGEEDFYWTVDGDVARALAEDRMVRPIIGNRAFIKSVELLVPVSELRRKFDLRWGREKRPKASQRAPLSSTGGGDQGLAPLIGNRRAIWHPPALLSLVTTAV